MGACKARNWTPPIPPTFRRRGLGGPQLHLSSLPHKREHGTTNGIGLPPKREKPQMEISRGHPPPQSHFSGAGDPLQSPRLTELPGVHIRGGAPQGAEDPRREDHVEAPASPLVVSHKEPCWGSHWNLVEQGVCGFLCLLFSSGVGPPKKKHKQLKW